VFIAIGAALSGALSLTDDQTSTSTRRTANICHQMLDQLLIIVLAATS
jgi:hypothetical protein